VLLTGAAGKIGRLIIERLGDQHEWILTDLQPPADTHGLPFIAADISDLDALRSLCKGVEVVLHLGAMSRPDAAFQDLMQPNIVGIYNLFQAASEAGCRRVIFASSLQVVDGYPNDVQVNSDMPVAPLSLYGATKAWGEAVAAYYVHQKGLSAICLRIGWAMPRNDSRIAPGVNHLDRVITHEDLMRLISASIDASNDIRFGIFHGVSNNRWKRLDISTTRAVLKYEPQDDAFVIAHTNYPGMLRHLAWRIKRKLQSIMGWK
jgi:nucleoside-diphosphate-sugar epimerase